MPTEPSIAGRVRYADLLAFRAPYLEERLTKDHVVASNQEAVAYFQEVKKYLVLCDEVRSRRMPMLSRVVDEVWHQFVLFTIEYTKFSERFFGRFMHHGPRNAPPTGDEPPEASVDEFIAAYEERFGQLPDLWQDWDPV